MYWSSKIGQDRSENVKMYVEFTQAQTRGVARGAGTVLFVLYESGYEKKVYLPESTGGKTPMCCEIALDFDLPFPRSAFLTFPFEAYLDSPDRTQHDQLRLVPSALFPDKSDWLGKWSMLRILIKNTFARAKRKSTKLDF